MPRVLVVGAGITGLTTAHELTMAGYDVTVVADKFDGLVSEVAGALFEWPPSVCGHHKDVYSLEEAKAWCLSSYYRFNELAANPNTGVTVRPVNFYFTHKIEEDPVKYGKMLELICRLEGFERNPHLAVEHGVSPEFGICDGYVHHAPTIDTTKYLKWFLHKCKKMGILFMQRRIEVPLVEIEGQLLKEFNAVAIVNCSGLGSYVLADDKTCNPHRGCLIRVKNDGRRFPKIDRPHCISHDGSDTQKMVFILPRGHDMLCLGGLVELEKWDTEVDLSYPPIQQMWERCVRFFPQLKNAEIMADKPVACGLRPSRPDNIRVGREHPTNSTIIHNYGHGGAGWTMSWGCAGEVVKIMHRMCEESQIRFAIPAPKLLRPDTVETFEKQGYYIPRTPKGSPSLNARKAAGAPIPPMSMPSPTASLSPPSDAVNRGISFQQAATADGNDATLDAVARRLASANLSRV